MKPADMQKVFEGAFTNGRPGSLSQFVRADQLLQSWTNVLSGFWSNPNAKTADMLKQLEQQTRQTSAQLQAEMGK